MTLAPLLRRINAEPDAALLLQMLGLDEQPTAPRVTVPHCAQPSRAAYVAGRCSCPGCRSLHARYMQQWRRVGRRLRRVTPAVIVVVKPTRPDDRRRKCAGQTQLEDR